MGSSSENTGHCKKAEAMPKDITHWIVAEKTAARLHETRLGQGALECPGALKLGAVFPDMPLYLTGRSHHARLAETVGHEYHGTRGADTYNLLRTILAHIIPEDHPVQKDTPALRAFLFGVACHLQTDIAFHPLVYYFTGNYHHPGPNQRSRAVRSHRRFEVLLDLQVCELLDQAPWGFQAVRFWKNLEARELLSWTRSDPAHQQRYSMLLRAIKKYLFAQRLFTHPAASRLAAGVHPFLPDAGKEITGLFYWSASTQCMERFRKKWHYLHPVTGEARSASTRELLDQAVEASALLCRRLETALEGKDPDLLDEYGPSLDYGLVSGNASQARYFAEPPFFDIPPCNKDA